MSFVSSALRYPAAVSSFLGLTRRPTPESTEGTISRHEVLWLIGTLAASQNASDSQVRADLLVAARVLQKRLGKSVAREILKAVVPAAEGQWLLTANPKDKPIASSSAADKARKNQARSAFVYEKVGELGRSGLTREQSYKAVSKALVPAGHGRLSEQRVKAVFLSEMRHQERMHRALGMPIDTVRKPGGRRKRPGLRNI